MRLTRLTGVANLPVRNISPPFFPHKSQVVRFLSVFFVHHILSEFLPLTEFSLYLHMLPLIVYISIKLLLSSWADAVSACCSKSGCL